MGQGATPGATASRLRARRLGTDVRQPGLVGELAQQDQLFGVGRGRGSAGGGIR